MKKYENNPMKIFMILVLVSSLFFPTFAFSQYMGNVGDNESGYTLEEALEIQRKRIESSESIPSITCGEGTKLENDKCVVDNTVEPICGSGTHLVNNQCIPKTTSTPTSSNGKWIKYDFSTGTNTNSRMYSVPTFGFSLSGGSYPYGSYSNSEILDTKFIKIELVDVKGSQITLVTKAIKNDGSEEFLDQSKMNYGENILVINPNVKIGDKIKLAFPEQQETSSEFGNMDLEVQSFTSILVGNKDLKAIKSTYDKTISLPGGIAEISLTTFHEKNTGMLLLLQGNFGGSSGGQYFDMDILLNAVEASDEFLKSNSSLGGGCLIATATYGSELAPQVQQLREIRDSELLQTESGTNFMNIFNDIYYSFSPYIADYERENPVFKEMVKVAITPMISSLSFLNYVDIDSESKVLGYGIILIVLNLVMYAGIPAVIIIGIRRK